MDNNLFYEKNEVKEILDYAIKKIEQNISTIKDQQLEIERLKKELENNRNMPYNYNYEKEEQIRKELKENAKKEAELIINEAKNNANKIPNYTKRIKELLNIEKPNRDLLFTIIDRIEADEDRNITIKFKYKILDDYTFKYIDKNPIRNPYGRCGKKSKI